MQIFPNGSVHLSSYRYKKASNVNGFPCLVFIDIDGMLNSDDSSGEIDPEMVQHLEHILNATNAGIVLSTGWRQYEAKKQELAEAIPGFNQRYVGDIPDLGAERSFWNEDGLVNRWDEIEAWLGENNYQGPYAVLDDRTDMIREHPSFFHTVTKGRKGLTPEIAKRVVNHLQSPTNKV